MFSRRTAVPLAPGPPGLPLLGSVFDLRRRGQLRFYLDHWRTYGDVIRFRLGPYVCHILAHPDHIHYVLAANAQNYGKGPSYAKLGQVLGNGLLLSEGDLWRSQRRLNQPPFTHKAVLGFGETMCAAITAMCDRWAQNERDGPLAIGQEMSHLALTILGTTIFGADLSQRIEPILAAVADAAIVVNRRLASFVDPPLYLPTPANRRIRAAIRRFDQVVYSLIQEREQRSKRGDVAMADEQEKAADLLDRLLAARDEESGQAMSERQLRDEVVTLLFAGHETSAAGLTWAWVLLAQHPDIEACLHAELDAVLGARMPTTADLPALPYTRQVVEETLRLCPPVWTFPRAALAEDEIGGYHIAAGSLIFPSQYLTHRHPGFWEEPDRFDPAHFEAARVAQRHRHAYYPFGGGPRTCIGFHFAMVEMMLVLATVAQRYRLRLVPGPPITPQSVVTLHPSRAVWMKLEDR